jgi:hypothetical protein
LLLSHNFLLDIQSPELKVKGFSGYWGRFKGLNLRVEGLVLGAKVIGYVVCFFLLVAMGSWIFCDDTLVETYKMHT